MDFCNAGWYIVGDQPERVTVQYCLPTYINYCLLVEEVAQPFRRAVVGGAWACPPTVSLDVPTVAEVLLKKSKAGAGTGAGAAAALEVSSSSCRFSASLNREHLH